MKARILLVIVLAGLLFLFPAPLHATPTGQGQQLFYDDFSTSQFSPYWSVLPAYAANNGLTSQGNASQAGGWLTLSELRSGLTSNCGGGSTGCAPSALQLTANTLTTPIVTSSTTSQFLYMAWRIVPFNLTQIGNNPGGNNAVRNAALLFGLMNVHGSTFFRGIGFSMYETDDVVRGASTPPGGGAREYIAAWIDNPQTSTAAKCFTTSPFSFFSLIPEGCSVVNNGPMYGNPNNQIDLNTVHLFTLEMSLQKDGTSWAAFEVDNNAWINMTQTACGCLESSPASNFFNLYPYIQNEYCIGTSITYCSSQTPSQSLGTLVNYVLVDNYVPSTLPAGSPAPSITINPINNPSATPLNPFNGISPSNLWQSFAVEIGKGVPTGTDQFLISPYYFGGAVLYAITVVMLLLATIFTPFDTMKNPFIVSLLLFFDTIANFALGTLSIWIFAGVLVFFIAVMVGTVPSTIGGKAPT